MTSLLQVLTPRFRLQRSGLRLAGLLGLLALCGSIFTARNPAFLSPGNLHSILQFSTLLSLVTLGQTLVVLGGGGGIDLSVGGIVSLSGLATGLLLKAGMPMSLAGLGGVLAGAALGAFNGFLVAGLKLLPLIATLGTFYAYNGLAVASTEGTPVSGLSPGFGALGQGSFGGVPLATLLVVAPAFVILQFALSQTPVGRWLYALGNNERACRLLGLPVGTMRFALYAISGALAGLAGLVADSWLLSARPNIGENLELLSLTAALLGGTDILGGSANLAGSLLAALFFTTLQAGLQMANVNAVWQLGIVGAFLILNVFVDRLLHRAANRGESTGRPVRPGGD